MAWNRALNRHRSHFLLHLSRVYHNNGVPRAPIQEASIRPLADALLAADAENRIYLNSPKRRIVFIRHPEHAVFYRTILHASRRAGTTRAALGDDRQLF